jgi:GNAT superfamily N-acetyltransferase
VTTAFSIRKATPEDHAAMAPLFERFYREEGFGEAVHSVAANLHAVLTRPDTGAFLAEADGVVVGVAALSSGFGLEFGKYSQLEDLYVLPEWRRRGVASALIEASVAWARARGSHDVEIVMTPHAQATSGLIEWYARRGFVNTERIIFERAVEQDQ